MKYIELDRTLSNCPKIWQNFMKSIYENPEYILKTPYGSVISKSAIDIELKKFNTRYIKEKNYATVTIPAFIEFADEEDYLIFKLKFG